MKKKQEQPPRMPGETALYEDDPFKLGKIRDSDLIEVSADFLPRPEELVFRPKGVKVTITLSENSLAFFKKKARQLDTSYQRMIRNLVDKYVERVKQP